MKRFNEDRSMFFEGVFEKLEGMTIMKNRKEPAVFGKNFSESLLQGQSPPSR